MARQCGEVYSRCPLRRGNPRRFAPRGLTCPCSAPPVATSPPQFSARSSRFLLSKNYAPKRSPRRTPPVLPRCARLAAAAAALRASRSPPPPVASQYERGLIRPLSNSPPVPRSYRQCARCKRAIAARALARGYAAPAGSSAPALLTPSGARLLRETKAKKRAFSPLLSWCPFARSGGAMCPPVEAASANARAIAPAAQLPEQAHRRVDKK